VIEGCLIAASFSISHSLRPWLIPPWSWNIKRIIDGEERRCLWGSTMLMALFRQWNMKVDLTNYTFSVCCRSTTMILL
jgi:hypothetical protein